MKSIVQTVAAQSSSQYSGHYDYGAKNKLGKKKGGGRGGKMFFDLKQKPV